MNIEIKIDSGYEIPKVIILTDKMSEEVNEIIRRISEKAPQIIAGFREDIMKILEQQEIIRIYSYGGKVFAVADDGEYTLRSRLYEVEERLGGDFVRISNSEIINLRKTESFDLSISGTICVRLKGGTTAYASRRYLCPLHAADCIFCKMDGAFGNGNFKLLRNFRCKLCFCMAGAVRNLADKA